MVPTFCISCFYVSSRRILQFFIDRFCNFLFSEKDIKALTSVCHGVIGGVPIPFDGIDKDGCKGIQGGCPLTAGKSYTFTTQIPVKKIYPSVRNFCYYSHTCELSHILLSIFMSPATKHRRHTGITSFVCPSVTNLVRTTPQKLLVQFQPNFTGMIGT